MNRWHDTAEKLHAALELALPPIAISLTDELPAGVEAFDGVVPAGCQFWERAAKGAFATVTKDHELCSIGVHTHNLRDPSPTHGGDLTSTLAAMQGLDYVREEDVAQIATIAEPVRHVVYAPLASTPVDPDVVMLFAHARQGLVIAEAAQQVEASAPPAMGRPACAIVPQAINSGRAAMSLGCCGARAYLDAMSDDVALWAIPGARIDVYAERIVALAKANTVLRQFHTLRKADIAAGGRPSVDESLARLHASS